MNLLLHTLASMCVCVYIIHRLSLHSIGFCWSCGVLALCARSPYFVQLRVEFHHLFASALISISTLPFFSFIRLLFYL